MGNVWHIGRKRIVAYLRPYIDLSPDFDIAWRKVRRWREKYGLPIFNQPNTTPYLDAEEFHLWCQIYLDKKEEIEAEEEPLDPPLTPL